MPNQNKLALIFQATDLIQSGMQILSNPYDLVAIGNFAQMAFKTMDQVKQKKQVDPSTLAFIKSLRMFSEHLAQEFGGVHDHLHIAREEVVQLGTSLHHHLVTHREENQQQVAGMHTHIAQGRKENYQNFVNIHQHLAEIKNEIQQGFKASTAILLKTVCQRFSHLETMVDYAIKQNQRNHIVATNLVDNVIRGVRRLERDNQTIILRQFGELLRKSYDMCRGDLTPSRQKIENLAAKLCNWIVSKEVPSLSASPMHTGLRYLTQGSIDDLPEVINEMFVDDTISTTMHCLGFLAYYAKHILKLDLSEEKRTPSNHGPTNVQEVFNPHHWQCATQCFLQLHAKFPQYFPIHNTRRLDEILATAQSQRQFHQSLCNAKLFEKLFDSYLEIILEIQKIVVDELLKEIKDKSKLYNIRLNDMAKSQLMRLNDGKGILPDVPCLVGEVARLHKKIIVASLEKIKLLLPKLNACRSLLIHYAIAAGFPSKLIDLLKINIWDGNEILAHFKENLHKAYRKALPHKTLIPGFDVTKKLFLSILLDKSTSVLLESECLEGVNILIDELLQVKFQVLHRPVKKHSSDKEFKFEEEQNRPGMFEKLKREMQNINHPILKKILDEMITQLEILSTETSKEEELMTVVSDSPVAASPIRRAGEIKLPDQKCEIKQQEQRAKTVFFTKSAPAVNKQLAIKSENQHLVDEIGLLPKHNVVVTKKYDL